MRRTFLLVILIVSPTLVTVDANQNSGFDNSNLSGAGRVAYQGLLSVEIFSIGSNWGEVPAGQRALHILLKEKDAVEACRGLIHHASMAGRLYGFFGLRFADKEAFEQEANQYKSRQIFTEGRVLWQAEAAQLSQEMVNCERGCLVWKSEVQQMIISIERGDFNEDFEWGRNRS